jgi:hypothetical protein
MADATFELTQDYPTALARLWATTGQREFVEQKYRSLGSTALQIRRFDASDGTIEVDLDRAVRVVTEKIPTWARILSGSRQTLRHHTRWERVDRAQINAELDISIPGKAVSAHGIGTVVELSPNLSRMTLSFHVKCNLPAIGAKVAGLFADQVKQALRADHQFTLSYLAGKAAPTRL